MLHLTTTTQIVGGLLIGLLCGAAHFMTLHWAVRLMAFGEFARAIAIQCARLCMLTIIFIALAKVGAAALLSSALSLLLARHLVLRFALQPARGAS